MALGQRDKKTGNFKFKTSLGCIARSYLQNKYIERGERGREARNEGKQEVGRKGGKEGGGSKSKHHREGVAPGSDKALSSV